MFHILILKNCCNNFETCLPFFCKKHKNVNSAIFAGLTSLSKRSHEFMTRPISIKSFSFLSKYKISVKNELFLLFKINICNFFHKNICEFLLWNSILLKKFWRNSCYTHFKIFVYLLTYLTKSLIFNEEYIFFPSRSWKNWVKFITYVWSYDFCVSIIRNYLYVNYRFRSCLT